MKKRGIIVILLMNFVLLLQGQTLEEREKSIVARNQIKSKTQWDYKYTNGKISGTGTKVSVTNYNHAGDILEKDILNNKGMVISSEKYEYDDNGNRTYYLRNTSNGKYEKRSQYDDHNNLLMEAGFDGAENFRNTYTYAANGKLQQIIFTVNNRPTEKHVYHNNGNTALVDIYTGGNSLTSKLKLIYDNKGNIVDQTVLNLHNKEQEKTIYKYDANSHILEEQKTASGGLVYRLVYKYDANGNLLTVSETTSSNKTYIKKSFIYDDKGNLTEYKWHRSPGEPFNVKSFTYDGRGICISEHTLYPVTKYELKNKFEYEFY